MKSFPSLRCLTLLVALGCAALSGCVAGKIDETKTTGTYVSPATLAQIQPGKSQDYVVGLLGQPAEKVALDPGNELWKWHYVEKTQSGGWFVFLFVNDKKTQTTKTTFVEFKDKLVTKSWSD
jgi:outer membrane protein assembly factor BamE (lipoprotein component of BamABCDE complex)